MSDKKTAEEIAKTIPCQCSDCGMRESEATQMIQAYADQELASLREELKIYERLSEDQDNTILYLNGQNLELIEGLKGKIQILKDSIPETEYGAAYYSIAYSRILAIIDNLSA